LRGSGRHVQKGWREFGEKKEVREDGKEKRDFSADGYRGNTVNVFPKGSDVRVRCGVKRQGGERRCSKERDPGPVLAEGKKEEILGAWGGGF